MFKIKGEYKGTIRNGFILAGESFFPGVKRIIKVDELQLKKLTLGEENGWFIIHSCEPKNPFLKVKTEEVKTEEVKTEEVKTEEVKTEEVKEEAPKKKTTKSKKKVEEVAE